jgi:aryl-alcohol dehydrogenase-like predicted oxidoreductase
MIPRRRLGDTGLAVSEVSFGTWALGGDWGEVSEVDGIAGIEAALGAGVNFFDTADVYGRGRAEELLGRVVGDRPESMIATKFCRWDGCRDPAT